MNAFDSARMVEAESLAILKPFLEDYSSGSYWISAKGPLAKCFQEQHGDVLFVDTTGTMKSVEMKAERKHTGNLFMEIWSNRNFDDRSSFLDRGCNPGWLSKLRSDYLFYHFLDRDTLYILNLWKLQRWAFGCRDGRAHIYDREYSEVVQRRHEQRNITVGRLVPLADLKSAGLVKVFFPKQSELWPVAAE
jgi:hypothetical protein